MKRAKSWTGIRIYTVGHSTRSFDELVELLRAFDISTVVDIRTVPRSRHNPQFNKEELRSTLKARRLHYEHIAELGGLRRARKDSPNTGWRNASFRGFADYMQTGDFEVGLDKLRALIPESHAALMCAEAVPWRCHRSLVADALLARGADVEHITGVTRSNPHHLTRFAVVDGTSVTYPGGDVGSLATRAPFHLEATVRVLQRRSTNLVDVWEGEKYKRVLATGDGLVLVEVTNHGTINRPNLWFSVLESREADPATVEPIVRRVLGLDVNPTPLQRLAEAEPGLGSTAVALRGMRPPRFAELFETFANVVPFQQVSLDAGVAVVRRLVERFGKTLEYGDRTYYAFPTAGAVAPARLDVLRRCGLSRQKAEALRGIARAMVTGELTEENLVAMDSDDAMRFLRKLPGIGPWSAALVLLRGLGRLDVFPPGDIGAARGLNTLLHLPQGQSLDDVVERFGARRGYLYFCSLGGALLARGLIHAAPPPRPKSPRKRSASK